MLGAELLSGKMFGIPRTNLLAGPYLEGKDVATLNIGFPVLALIEK